MIEFCCDRRHWVASHIVNSIVRTTPSIGKQERAETEKETEGTARPGQNLNYLNPSQAAEIWLDLGSPCEM